MSIFNTREEKRVLAAFIRQQWTDQKLAEVFAFAEDGKMNYANPCACILGVTLSDRLHVRLADCPDVARHYERAEELAGAGTAEAAFSFLTIFVKDGPQLFLRLLRAEMRLRAWQRRKVQASEPECAEYAGRQSKATR